MEEIKKINTNLEIAKTEFIHISKNFKTDALYYIQYRGAVLIDSNIYFNFKSSNNSINFKVYAGVDVNDCFLSIKSKTNYIFNFFEDIKNTI